jgi:RimJ/RimL family protein N-acetyltransferase
MSIAKEEVWFEEMIKRPPIEQPMTIEVEENGDWIPIGNTGFFDINNIARSAELGIMIGNKDYWDKGCGTLVMKLMLKHGFEVLNLNRIYLLVKSNNPRAIRCYEKVGFMHEGSMRQAEYQDGKYFDLIMMSVLKHEWNHNF